MLRKRNKLVLLVVLAAFMFSIVGSAGAATFTDVKGNAAASDIYRLNGLGIIDGYPDGTFAPDKTVTRAEFAKIAVVTAGLKNVASGMANVPSTFSDVSSNDWFNGWVNVAAAQGFVKGYPDGTFKPQAEITQAEVVTVLLRILGYNDNLTGEWPSDYIAKAANLGVLDDVTFVANKAATRGEVAIITSAVLDENVVSYKASDNVFEEKKKNDKTYTLLADKFSDSAKVEDALVTGVNLSNGKVKLTLSKDGEDARYELNENCVITHGLNWNSVYKRFVDYDVNDDDEITSITLKDYKVVTMEMDDIKVKTVFDVEDGKEVAKPAKISLDGKDYDCVKSVVVPEQYEKLFGVVTSSVKDSNSKEYKDLDALRANLSLPKVDSFDFVCNDDGDIALIKVNAWNSESDDTLKNFGIVDKVNVKNAKINFKNAGSVGLDKDDAENYYILKNGAPAALEDIKADDLVYNYAEKNNKGVENYLVVTDSTKSGELEAYEHDGDVVTKITLDGTVYDVEATGTVKEGKDVIAFLFSDDEGDSFTTGTKANIEDTLDETVTVWLNPAGKIAAVSTATTSSSKIYGVINDTEVTSLVNGKIEEAIEVLKTDDTLATYAKDADSQMYADSRFEDMTKGYLSSIAEGSFVELTLNRDGYIDQIKVSGKLFNKETEIYDEVNQINKVFKLEAGNIITGDKDTNVVTVDGSSYDARDVVIFSTLKDKDSDDMEIISRADFMDNIDDKNIKVTAPIWYKAENGKIKYLVIAQEELRTSDTNLCMIAKTGRDKDGNFVNILLPDGSTQKYTCKTDGEGFIKNNVYSYELSSGDIKNKEWATTKTTDKKWNIADAVYTVEDVNGNILKLKAEAGGDAVNFYVDADTLYWDSTETDPEAADLGDIGVGDTVKIFREDITGALDGVQIVD